MNVCKKEIICGKEKRIQVEGYLLLQTYSIYTHNLKNFNVNKRRIYVHAT